MAVMIPSVISPSVKSAAERKIFEWFRDAPHTDDWVVLHSLGIATHDKLVFGEADFFVLAPRLGLFALEVKGGRVARKDGMWCFTDRYGKTSKKARGPFDQARESSYNIAEIIKKKVDFEHRHLQEVLFNHGVMFPDIEFDASGVEEEQWQVFDGRDGRDVRTFVRRLSRGAQDRWKETRGSEVKPHRFPSAQDVKYLASILRGDFDYTLSMGVRLRDASEEILRLTNEQYRCLDQLDDNPRCLIRGSAGTGKTLLAMKKAECSAAEGEKVAFFCFNSNLAEWLNSRFEELDENLRPAYVGTLHKYMTQQCARAGIPVVPPADEDDASEYYRSKLPELALEALLETEEQFDRIIVDEAQDLICDEYLQVLDISLAKGLSRGKWIMFGDFSKQAIYAEGLSGEDMVSLLEDCCAGFVRFKLSINCRNTKPICEEVQYVTGLDASNDLWLKVDGPPVEYATWESEEGQVEKIEALLKKLAKEGVPSKDIIILSPKKYESSAVSLLKETKVRAYSPTNRKGIAFCTIQGFKGLESTVIVLVDVDSYSAEKLLYVGLSRAKTGLFVFESKRAQKERNAKMLSRMMR